MNKYFKSLCLCAAALTAGFLASCSDDDNGPGNGLKLTDGTKTEQTVYADQTSGQDGIRFYAPAAWTATVTDISSSRADTDTADWLTLSAYSGGAGEHTITVSIAPNTTGRNRMARITIDCDGTMIKIIVEQKASRADGSMVKPIRQIVYTEECGDFQRSLREMDDFVKDFAYDERGRVVRVITTWKSENYEDDIYRTDLDYRIDGEIEASVIHQYQYDPTPHARIIARLNENGNVTRLIDADDYSSQGIMAFKYDSDGRLARWDELYDGIVDDSYDFYYTDGFLSGFKHKNYSDEVIKFTRDNYPNRYPNNCQIDILGLLMASDKDTDFVFDLGLTGRTGDYLIEYIPVEHDQSVFPIKNDWDTPNVTIHQTYTYTEFTSDTMSLSYVFGDDKSLSQVKISDPYDVFQHDYDIVVGNELLYPDYPESKWYRFEVKNSVTKKVGSGTRIRTYDIKY